MAAKEFSSATDDLLFLREYLLPTLIKIGSPQFRRFIVDLLPWKKLRRFRDIVDTMDRVTTHIFEEKKKILVDSHSSTVKQDGQRKDLLSILMKANIAATSEDRLPDKEVLAQNDLRNEVTGALRNYGDSDIPYDELMSLPLMDAVCRETLRLYPPLTFVTRV
ncbi:hypothetical protein H0H87_009936 [Tephrocybe sp. NHM501043]|nr:hypothetical protein H0H87_009936 [Tephrocybe sp. NHM501043]